MLPQLHKRLHQAATPGKAMQGPISRTKDEHAWALVQHFCHLLCKHCSTTSALFAGTSGEQAGPDISQLAPNLQQEWDHAANAHLGKIVIMPQSNRMAWWRSSMCKTGQPHRWQAQICNRTNGARCPYKTGRAACPCNDVAHKHPEVAAEWDWEANERRTPETVTAGSEIKAAWRCGLCG